MCRIRHCIIFYTPDPGWARRKARGTPRLALPMAKGPLHRAGPTTSASGGGSVRGHHPCPAMSPHHLRRLVTTECPCHRPGLKLLAVKVTLYGDARPNLFGQFEAANDVFELLVPCGDKSRRRTGFSGCARELPTSGTAPIGSVGNGDGSWRWHSLAADSGSGGRRASCASRRYISGYSRRVRVSRGCGLGRTGLRVTHRRHQDSS